MDRTESFGYWVRRRRKAMDLTQPELARRVGCALDTIKKIESDSRRPSRQLAELLAEQLAIPAEERPSFIQSARAQRSTGRLTLPERPVAIAGRYANRLSLPATAPSLRALSPFVGRERELGILGAQLAATLQGQGRTVLVMGEAGQGKTALLNEFARRAQAAHHGLIVVTGSGNAFSGIGDPYLPFRDFLNALTGDATFVGAGTNFSQEQARRLVACSPDAIEMLVEYGRDLIDVFVPATALLGRAAERSLKGTRQFRFLESYLGHENVRPGERQQAALIQQYTTVLQQLALRHPLILVVDDLQWIDDASINLLFHLTRHLSSSQIMIVGAYRGADVAISAQRTDAGRERSHPLRSLLTELTLRSDTVQIDLGDVPADENRDFVDRLLDSEPNKLDEDFRAELFKRTKGHPLFTVELLRNMQAGGDLVRDEQQRWVQASALDWNRLPARVEAVIEQRLDRLDEELRNLLNLASVEGEEFTAEVLARVQKTDEGRILRLLSHELAGRYGLIRERSETTTGAQRLSSYRFGHILFQHYLYRHLGSGERKWLHGQIALALEALWQHDVDSVATLLARHFAAAGQHDAAVRYARRAASRAVKMSAFEEAAKELLIALRLLPDDGPLATRIAIVEELADAYALGREGMKALEHYRKALELSSQTSEADESLKLRLHRKIMQTVIDITWAVDHDQVQAAARTSDASRSTLREVARRDGELATQEGVRLLTALSMDAWHTQSPPNWDSAQRYAEAAVSAAEHLGDSLELSSALGGLAHAYHARSSLREYLNVSQRRLAIANSPGFPDLRERLDALRELGSALMYVGAYDQAIPRLREATDLAVRLHAVDQQFASLAMRTQCHFRMDQWDEMLDLEFQWRDLEQRYGQERIGVT